MNDMIIAVIKQFLSNCTDYINLRVVVWFRFYTTHLNALNEVPRIFQISKLCFNTWTLHVTIRSVATGDCSRQALLSLGCLQSLA